MRHFSYMFSSISRLPCFLRQTNRTARAYSSNNRVFHIPVMHKEVLTMFDPQHDQKFLDMTFGAGGHTRKLLSSCNNATVYTLDRDPFAYDLAIKLASETTNGNISPLLGKFSDLPELLSDGEVENFFDGILIDCGCSSMQYDMKERGFSLSKDGPLDMRMDQDRLANQPSAKDILAHIDENSLARILKVYGEEKQAKKIARAIVEARYLFTSLNTTNELAQLVESACGFSSRTDKLQRSSHVATKTFQALRILVNDELNELDFAVRFAHRALKIGGKLITITFHSLEDRIVKNHLHDLDYSTDSDQKYKNYARQLDPLDVQVLMERQWQEINKHVLTPSDEEINENPRSRSAKLRAAIKLR